MIRIYFGSQTGNSFELAARIEYLFRLNSTFKVGLFAMNDFDFTNKPTVNDFFIFCVSTTGQGDPPDDSKDFYYRLMDKSLDFKFAKSKFCFFAMGDSSYARYNWVGLAMARRLEQLGGELISDVFLCDERHQLGYDFQADKGIEIVKQFLEENQTCNFFPGDSKNFKVKYPVKIQTQNEHSTEREEFIKTDFHQSKVVFNERATSEKHFQNTRHIRFEIPPGLSYDEGDVVNIYPQSPNSYVDLVFEATKWDRSLIIDFINSPHPNVKLPAKLETLMKEEFDLVGIPRRHFFAILALYSNHALEKERLEEFCASDGTDDRWDYANRPRRSLAESLADFPNTVMNFPIEAIFELFPLIRPRPYSICSYSTDHIEILCAVVKYRSRMQRPRIGICSNYLNNLKPGDKVHLKLTKGTFRLPPDGELLMIGPGTGLAPFRSIIQSRVVRGIDISSSVLFFGCRGPETDLYFKDEFEKTLKRFNAFSRFGEKNQYVQQKIKEESEIVFDHVMGGGIILIAGKAQDMPEQVKEAIVECFMERGGFDRDMAKTFLNTLEDQGRLQQETW